MTCQPGYFFYCFLLQNKRFKIVKNSFKIVWKNREKILKKVGKNSLKIDIK